MRRMLVLAIASAISTAASAVTFPFPTDNTLEHTATFDGTVGQANANGIGASNAGDYLQASLVLPQLTFSNYSFIAPLIDYNLMANESFNILLNGTVIGGFTVTPQIAAAGVVSGSNSFAAMTVAGPTTLRIELTNSVNRMGSLGVGTNGQFTLSVPEPASWATMVVGFGLMGWSIRRRKASLALPLSAS